MGDVDHRRRRVGRLVAQLVDLLVDEQVSGGAASRWMRAVDSPLGRGTVAKLVADGTIAATKPAKHLLIDRVQHDGWIAEHAVDRAVAAVDDDDVDPIIMAGGRR